MINKLSPYSSGELDLSLINRHLQMNLDFFPKNNDDDIPEELLNQELNLLVWALFFNKIEIAKIFWRIGEVIS